MGAKRNFENLFGATKKQYKSSNATTTSKEKQVVENYRHKISELLKDKKNAKKAALIIEKMIQGKN